MEQEEEDEMQPTVLNEGSVKVLDFITSVRIPDSHSTLEDFAEDE